MKNKDELAKIIYEAKLEMLAEFESKIKRYYNIVRGGTPAALVAYHVGVVADEIREKMEDEFYGTETD